ncbi:hypothetical protein DPX16_5865 [Anabarilius grahami]|uniref:Uncharacterized protein n=1 Tax=Anabarilius grahami TaxID=495550 RepID=A0A3N0Y2W7_ANAGA|nr:hypothetical protein DPX16_5865 [Anabarilius grahami]
MQQFVFASLRHACKQKGRSPYSVLEVRGDTMSSDGIDRWCRHFSLGTAESLSPTPLTVLATG